MTSLERINKNIDHINYILDILKPRYFNERHEVTNIGLDSILVDLAIQSTNYDDALMIGKLLHESKDPIVNAESWLMFMGKEITDLWDSVLEQMQGLEDHQKMCVIEIIQTESGYKPKINFKSV